MKRILKWMGAAVLVPIVLVSSVAGLLYFPPFQRWAVKQVAAYASEKTGMDISVGQVRLEFPLDLGLDDVKVIGKESRDTIADIEHAVAKVRLWPLLKKRVEIDELTFKQAKINTVDFVDAAHVKGTIGELSLKSHGIDLVQRVFAWTKLTFQTPA